MRLLLLMLACRYQIKQSEYMEKAPAGTLSTKGVGGTHPNPKQAVTVSGAARSMLIMGRFTSSAVCFWCTPRMSWCVVRAARQRLCGSSRQTMCQRSGYLAPLCKSHRWHVCMYVWMAGCLHGCVSVCLSVCRVSAVLFLVCVAPCPRCHPLACLLVV